MPGIVDLHEKAKKKIPKVALEYLETGTDDDQALRNNIRDFSHIRFRPSFLKGTLDVKLSTTLFGHTYSAPFGIAPVGLTGLMWPGIEIMLAKAANEMRIPYCLSTVATETPEVISSHISEATGWFQLYTPPDMDTTKHLLARVRKAGFKTLVITVDIPQPSRRQRTKRAGLTMPPKLNPQLIWDGITHPHWLTSTLKRGLPQLKTIANYESFKMSVAAFTSKKSGSNLSWDYVLKIKELWEGQVLLKGIMHAEDADLAANNGFDGIVVSNHGGRQFDGCVSSISVLPEIASVIQKRIPIIFDGGIRSGLDIVRAMALGADFTLLGRAFIYSVCALQALGPYHAYQILFEEMENNMRQLGIETLDQISSLSPLIEDHLK